MAKLKDSKAEPRIFRVMTEEFPYKHATVDFLIKEDALQYAHGLTSDTTAWYGVYERHPKRNYLIMIEHKRLRPHDNKIITKPKEDEADKPKRKPARKAKQK